MDSFDCIKNTKSGKGIATNTVLMTFQKQGEKNKEIVYTSKRKLFKKLSVDTFLKCQKILSFRKFGRSDLVYDFVQGTSNVQQDITLYGKTNIIRGAS